LIISKHFPAYNGFYFAIFLKELVKYLIFTISPCLKYFLNFVIKKLTKVLFFISPNFPKELTIAHSKSSLILITLYLVNYSTKALMAALLFLPILPMAFAAYIYLITSGDFNIAINSSIISILGIPSLSNDSAAYKAISPFNKLLSKCYLISFIISPFLSSVHILTSPSIRGCVANELVFDNLSLNF
jgi:hypothetical protein